MDSATQKLLDNNYDLVERKQEVMAELKDIHSKLVDTHNALSAAGIDNFMYYEKGKPFDETTGPMEGRIPRKKKLSVEELQDKSNKRHSRGFKRRKPQLIFFKTDVSRMNKLEDDAMFRVLKSDVDTEKFERRKRALLLREQLGELVEFYDPREFKVKKTAPPVPAMSKREVTRMKRAEEFEVKIMGLILKADGLEKKKRGRKPTKKAATILRNSEKAGRRPVKAVDFSKVQAAATKVPFKTYASESPEKPFIRPAAVYTNIPTPYGIATEMLAEQLKKSG